jgi:hypothetical protein
LQLPSVWYFHPSSLLLISYSTYSGISRDGYIAFIDQDHLKIFQYDYQSHHLRSKKSIPISNDLKIKVLTWGPARSRYFQSICYCTDEFIEIFEIFGSFSKRITYPRTQITSMVWSEDNNMSCIYLTTNSDVHKIDLSLEDTFGTIPVLSLSIGLVSLFVPTTQEIFYSQKKTLAGSSLCIRSVVSNPQRRSQEIHICPDNFALRALSHCTDRILIASSEPEVQVQSSFTTSVPPAQDRKSLVSIMKSPLIIPQSGLTVTLPSKSISIISSTSEDNLEPEISREHLPVNDNTTHKGGPFPHALPENGRTLQEILSVTSPVNQSSSHINESHGSGIIDSLFSIASLDDNIEVSPSAAELPPHTHTPPLLSVVTRNEDSSFRLVSSIPLFFTTADGITTTLTRPDIISSYLHTRPGGSVQLYIAVSSSASNSVLIYTFALPLLGETCESPQQPHQIYTLHHQVLTVFVASNLSNL